MRRRLNPEQIAEIRRLQGLINSNFGLVISLKELAFKFGVTPKAIAQVLQGKTYREIAHGPRS